MLASLLLLSLLQSQSPTTNDPAAAPAEPSPGAAAPADAPPPLEAAQPSEPAAGAAASETPNALPKADAKVEGVDGFLLKGAQLAGCGGVYLIASATSLVLSYVPFVGGCVGCASCLVMPAVYGTTVTVVGNFLSPRQAPLLWPIVTMYVGSLVTSLVAIGAFVGTFVALGLGASTLAQAGNPALLFGALFVPLIATVAVSFVGMVATGVIATFVWDANSVPKTEPGQFQLAFTDMNEPIFGGKPKQEPPKTPTGTSASLRTVPAVPAMPRVPMRF